MVIKMEDTQNNLKMENGILIKNLIMARDVIDEIWCDEDAEPW